MQECELSSTAAEGGTVACRGTPLPGEGEEEGEVRLEDAILPTCGGANGCANLSHASSTISCGRVAPEPLQIV